MVFHQMPYFLQHFAKNLVSLNAITWYFVQNDVRFEDIDKF